MQTQAQQVLMETLHHQMLGLAVLIVLAVIIAVCAPPIRRMRSAGETAGANRRAGLMFGLMGATVAVGLIIITR